MLEAMKEEFEKWHGYPVTDDMDIHTAVAWDSWRIAWNAALKQAQGDPVAWQDIVAALKAVDAEAWERGRMYPQHSDEQDGDRAAIRRACGLVEWYATKGGSVAMHLPLWPKHPTSAPSIPADPRHATQTPQP